MNTIENLNLIVLNAGYAIHDGDWNWKDVCSPFSRLYYVTKGSAEIIFEDDKVTLSPGNIYLVPPFVKHSNRCNSHFEHYYIHIYEDSPSSNRLFEEFEFPHSITPGKFDLDLFLRLCELNPSMKVPHSNPETYDNQPTLIQSIRMYRMRSLADRIKSRGILFLLAGRFLEEARQKPHAGDDRIQTALNYIRKNTDTRLTVEELATNCSLSNEHFIRLFKKEMGMTPIVYITKEKMKRAMILLATNSSPVKEISLSIGYDDNSYFIRTFKKATGMTPQEFRESYKFNLVSNEISPVNMPGMVRQFDKLTKGLNK